MQFEIPMLIFYTVQEKRATKILHLNLNSTSFSNLIKFQVHLLKIIGDYDDNC